MRQIQINRKLILREDGKLFNVRTGEEFIPKARGRQYIQIWSMNKLWYLHCLVMEFFGPPKPAENYEIDHFDRNPENNNISNLRWVTHQENIHNRKCNRPIGQRRCDLPLDEYYRRNSARYRKKYPEKNKEAIKRCRAKKKEGG